jgi:cyclophilin family peptidyl-prolyl cis-trans isomerase
LANDGDFDLSNLVRGRWAVLVVICGLFLASCGTSNEGSNSTVETPTASSNTDADITSGCWTAADRGTPIQEGTDSDVAIQQWTKAPEMVIDTNKTYRATLETSAGNVEVEFFPKEAPATVNNFVCLARAGFYDETPFHRIVQGFVVQGGDPTGTGTGGPGYKFADEPISADRNYTKGTLAMANSGQNTNGSQFFICTADLTGKLGKNYNLFGQVVGGMDIVEKLDQTPTQVRNGEKSSPIDPVTLNKVSITES